VKQLRKRLTYANVMSSIAVFLVIGGATAFAALGKNTVGSKQLKKNAVTTKKIKNNAVTTPKIKNGAVTAEKLAAGAVTVGAGSITNEKLANGSVTNDKLANGSVTNEKLAEGAVTGNKIAGGTVTKGNLAEGTLLPRAFALVEFNGEVDPKFTVGGIPTATQVGSAYCFDTPFPVLHAQATGVNPSANLHIQALLDGLEKIHNQVVRDVIRPQCERVLVLRPLALHHFHLEPLFLEVALLHRHEDRRLARDPDVAHANLVSAALPGIRSFVATRSGKCRQQSQKSRRNALHCTRV